METVNRSFEISSEADMAKFAAKFAATLAAVCCEGLLIGLSGTLGAGKTFFVREVAFQVGADREIVCSPTYTLCNEYPSTPRIYHLDLYRVRDEDEYYGLGIDEMCGGESIVFVEWADRFADELPPERLNLHIDLTSETARRIELTATGDQPKQIAESINWGESN